MAGPESPQSLLPYPTLPGTPAASSMSIKLRFLLFAGAMLVVFAATLLLLRRLEAQQVEAALEAGRWDARRQMERLLDYESAALRQLVRDWSAGDLPGPVAGGEAAVDRWQLIAQDFGADAIWLISATGTVEPVYPPGARDLLVSASLVADATGSPHHYVEADGLWEIVRAPRVDQEGGWHVVGRRWTLERVEALAERMDAAVRLLGAHESGGPQPTGRLVVERPWLDARGRVVRTLRAERSFAERDPTVTDAAMIRLLVGFGLLLLTALALAVHQWVLRPLHRIGESLARESAAPLQGLDSAAEFVRLARLVEESFAQKTQLRREVAERRRTEERLQATQEDLRQSIEVRSRLARNLHDTVIQSIYATGLGLESARAELGKNPAAADERLAHCRTNLNETIREVRGFINDLEPESLRRQPFAQALRSLAFTMQSLWVATINVELDERVAERFTGLQETHLLQIVREAISNALRHGEASRIHILLQADVGGANALLKVQDNGRGFDPAHRTGEGRGLVNMANRIREIGGSLRLQTEPGAGTQVVLRIPFASQP